MRVARFTITLLAATLAARCGPSPRPPAADEPAQTVSLGRAALADLAPPFEAGGILRARTTAAIASRVMAPIAAVHVRPGDRVTRGAPLVTLDAREMTANRARAAAALAAAVEAARAAESDVRAADAALQLARATHDRVSGLFAKRSATAQELDQAVAGVTASDAQRVAAQARAAAAAAARDAAHASMDATDVNVSYAVLSAPFDGLVTERRADPGSMAVPGAPLLTVEDARSFRLEVQLDEARARVGVDQPVDVRLDTDEPSRWRAGRVAEIARVDPLSHSFLVKIDLPEDAALRSGLFGRARFPGPSRRTLTIPAAALVPRGQLTFVFVVDADGLARLRAVTAGAASDDRVEILAGVRDGDLVVSSPPESLADGARVKAGGPAQSGASRPGASR